jgi:hypothetical protein
MGEILFHIFLLGVLAIFGVNATDINTARANDPLGPAGFPIIIIVFISLLLVISLVKTIKKYREKHTHMNITATGFKRIISLLISLVVFVFITNRIGFIISIFILFIAMFNIMGQKGKKGILLSIASSIVIISLFAVVLSVPLPRGLGIFKELSYLIY